MDLLPEILNRYSVHQFREGSMDPEALQRILEAGRLAPSAKNRQPWRFVVVQDAELRRKFQEAAYNEPGVGQASAIIAVCSTNIDYRMPNGQLSYPIDLAMSAAFMGLQAVREGFGTCINTTFNEDEIRDLLTVPYSMRVVLLLLVGFPGETMTMEHSRLPLGRLVSYEHW
ncbi:MAG: nitroreductase family protein [Spirochaetales bacterium]